MGAKINQENDREISDLERAAILRREADFLESRERVKSRLRQLMKLSADPYYDQYLAQMWRDLESGKATPAQVEQEAQRSYLQYQRRMAQIPPAPLGAQKPEPVSVSVEINREENRDLSASELDTEKVPAAPAEGNRLEEIPKKGLTPILKPGKERMTENALEFKVGVHVFGMIGALFVLVAFVIFGFYFLKGLGQGLCLYGAALVVVICSQLLEMRKKQAGFFGILTGIGVGGLYIANIVNYLVLHTINEIEMMTVSLVIALASIFLGRKRDSAWIRIISLAGCYLCFFPARGFGSELYFLVVAVMLLVVNTAGTFFRNQNHRMIINVVHLFLNTGFSILLTQKAWTEEIGSVYLVFYVATAFIFVSILSIKECMKEKEMPFALCCVGNGVLLFLLFLVGNLHPQVVERPELALFVHLTAEILFLTICLITFMFWEKEDGRRWAQLYYAAGVILLCGSFSEYHWEIILSVLLTFLTVKLFSAKKEVLMLDCITVFWVLVTGIRLWDDWYCWFFAAALLVSVFRIKQAYLYHEFVVTAGILLIWWRQCRFYFLEEFDMNGGWLYPVSVGAMLILFLLFNHLPGLKNKKQQPYNITSLVVMSVYYFMVWFWHSYIFSSIMMVLGGATILIVFRKRYELQIPRKYLVLAGFLTWFSLTGHYESPIIVSILLMIIALVCVGVGFRQQDRVERICGLVMAFFVCLKLVLYDFREVEVMYRMLVFLVVGVIALMISFIYVKLEKKEKFLKEKFLKIKKRSQNTFDVIE